MKKFRKKIFYFSFSLSAITLSTILLSACSTNLTDQANPNDSEENTNSIVSNDEENSPSASGPILPTINSGKEQEDFYQNNSLFKDFSISIKNKIYPSQLLLDLNSDEDLKLNKVHFNINKANNISDDNILLKAKSFDDNDGSLTLEVTISQDNKTETKEFKFDSLNEIHLFKFSGSIEIPQENTLVDAIYAELINTNVEYKNIETYLQYFNDEKLTRVQKLDYLKSLGTIVFKNNQFPLKIEFLINKAINRNNTLEVKYSIQVKQRYLKANEENIKYRTYRQGKERELNIIFKEKESTLLEQVSLNSTFDKGNVYPSWFEYVFDMSDHQIEELFKDNSNTPEYHGKGFNRLGTGYSDIELIFSRNLSNEEEGAFVHKMFNLPNYDYKKYSFRVSSITEASDQEGTMKVILKLYDKGNNFNDYHDSLREIDEREFFITGLNKWNEKDFEKFNVSFYYESKTWSNFLNRIESKIDQIWDDSSGELDLTTSGQNLKNNLENFFNISYNGEILSIKHPNLYPFPIKWWESFDRNSFLIKKLYIKNYPGNNSGKYLYADIEFPINIQGFGTYTRKQTIYKIIHKNDSPTKENPKYVLK